jgi:hypothetical protein
VPERFDVAALAAAAEGFSGAEIEQAIVSAMYAGHVAKRRIDGAFVAEELPRAPALGDDGRARRGAPRFGGGADRSGG